MLSKFSFERIVMLVTTIIVCIMIIYPIGTLIYIALLFRSGGNPSSLHLEIT